MIRLEELPFELGGKTYRLRCNMNVLADAQAAFGGDFGEALNPDNSFRSLIVFLAAMLNDYADEMGWEERWTERSLGRVLNKHQVPEHDIMGLVVASMAPQQAESESDTQAAKQAPDNSGN